MGNFHSVIFPRPDPSYSDDHPYLFAIPSKDKHSKIPFLFKENLKHEKTLVIFFHGNAEDAGIAYGFVDALCDCLSAHGIVVEYPGYGVY